MGQVEGCNAQRPETAEHGEDTEAQMVPWGHHEKVVLALCVTGVVALQKEQMGMEQKKSINKGTTLSCPLKLEVQPGTRRSLQESCCCYYVCKYFSSKGSPQLREPLARTGREKPWVQGYFVIL